MPTVPNAHFSAIQGGWTVPGTISACPVNMPIPTSSPENPLGSSATSAPTALTSSALLPLVYWFGHVETRRNPKLMDRLIQNLAGKVNARLRNDSPGSSGYMVTRMAVNKMVHTGSMSGLIIDTPASYATPQNGKSGSGEKYAFIKTCVDLFKSQIIFFSRSLISIRLLSQRDSCHWA